MGEVLFEHELWRRRRMKAERETTGKAWMRDTPEQQFQEEYEEDLSQRGGRSRKRRAREWREDEPYRDNGRREWAKIGNEGHPGTYWGDDTVGLITIQAPAVATPSTSTANAVVSATVKTEDIVIGDEEMEAEYAKGEEDLMELEEETHADALPAATTEGGIEQAPGRKLARWGYVTSRRQCSHCRPHDHMLRLSRWTSTSERTVELLQTHINFPRFLPIFSDFLK
jgi:hypothetical protein